MEEATTMFSVSSLLSVYASFCTFFMFLQNAYHELVPHQLKSFLFSKLSRYFPWNKRQSSLVTLIIDDSWEGYSRNKLIRAASTYLSTKIGPKNKRIRIAKFKKAKEVIFSLVDGEEVVDFFDGMKITWRLVLKDRKDSLDDFPEVDEHFELTFEEKYRDRVVSEYFDYVLNTCEEMKKEEKGLKIYSSVDEFWLPVKFKHPALFRNLAMDSELKKVVMNDLDRFLDRQEYYKRVGKAWKRCYLLYGPPGAGKSSLVAAMANYLRYDIYELELPDIFCEFHLRRLLMGIEGNCIVVVEDIDCNSRPSGTESESNEKEPKDEEDSDGEDGYHQILAADVLHCIEGLWAKSEEQRIVVLTTNHKEALEAGLDVPGLIDMHIHMSYCSVEGFRILAHNYLGIEHHPLFEEIDELIRTAEVTPAALAEELLKNDDADNALCQVISFLRQKKIENCRIDQA